MQPRKSVMGLIRITTFAMLMFVACYVMVQFRAPSSDEAVSPSTRHGSSGPVTPTLQEQARVSLLDDNAIACFSVGNALGQKLTSDCDRFVPPLRRLSRVVKNIPLPTNLNVVHTKAVANLPQAPPFST